MKIWLQLALQFQRRSRLKLLKDDGRRRTTEPAYTICSPGAIGSGELKITEDAGFELLTPDVQLLIQ